MREKWRVETGVKRERERMIVEDKGKERKLSKLREGRE